MHKFLCMPNAVCVHVKCTCPQFVKACCAMCILFIYTIPISIICTSQEELSFIASNQHTWLLKVSNFAFLVPVIIIQCNTDSCCEYIAVGVNMSLWVCQSIGPWVCCVSSFVCLCMCVCVCEKDILNQQSTSNKPHMSDLSKLDALLHKTHSKVVLVLQYKVLRYVDP